MPQEITPEVLLTTLLIFSLRVLDTSVDTFRIYCSVRGKTHLAAVFGFIESFVFIFAISQVLTRPMHLVAMLGYAGGFATGTFVGTAIARRLATTFMYLRILSDGHAEPITEALRGLGYTVTVVPGEGHGRSTPIIFCLVRRRDSERVLEMIQEIDAEAFISFEPIERAVGGYIPNFAAMNRSVAPMRS